MILDIHLPKKPVASGMSVLAAISILATACGSGTTARRSSPIATSSSSAGPAASGSSAATQSSVIEVTAADYMFMGLPATVGVGSKLELNNTSAKEVHEMVVFRLPDGDTRSAGDLAALPLNQLQATFGGPPTMVLIAPPQSAGQPAVGDGTFAKPGRYVAFCAVPTGSDPTAYLAAAEESKGGPPNVRGGAPHYMEGMITEFTVS